MGQLIEALTYNSVLEITKEEVSYVKRELEDLASVGISSCNVLKDRFLEFSEKPIPLYVYVKGWLRRKGLPLKYKKIILAECLLHQNEFDREERFRGKDLHVREIVDFCEARGINDYGAGIDVYCRENELNEKIRTLIHHRFFRQFSR